MSLVLIPPEAIHNGNGGLYLITGGMKGAKTLAFLIFFESLKYAQIPFQLFKPMSDYRPELHERQGMNIPREYIVSRTGMHLPAELVNDQDHLDDLLKKLDPTKRVFGFDEFHFYKYGAELRDIILDLRYEQKKVVVVGGLDRDFRGDVFPLMGELMAHATVVEKHFGICDVEGCQARGELSQRLIDGQPAPYDNPIIKVGASELYEARCPAHHIVLGKPIKSQTPS